MHPSLDRPHSQPQTASGSNQPFATVHFPDRETDRPTDRHMARATNVYQERLRSSELIESDALIMDHDAWPIGVMVKALLLRLRSRFPAVSHSSNNRKHVSHSVTNWYRSLAAMLYGGQGNHKSGVACTAQTPLVPFVVDCCAIYPSTGSTRK